MVVMVFILNTPKHRCAIPGLVNDTFQVESPSHQLMLNMTVPHESSCKVYAPGNYTYDVDNRPVNATLESCDRWVYDTTIFTKTVASQFDLVCENETKRSHATMAFYGGFLVGVFVLGAVSDM
ncbi:organic cation transporter protein-like [Plakobranchus ocellatus]|uniref:Organic cation transporter protein-like n=1 Tax=Plakobranchus ocellatus TaxID=259542 RepID=A0AAV3Y6Z3_9GAST|nr:organic cation transporter protein-like [Plakobranchus ocellatus]